MTVDEIARHTRVSRRTVYRWIDAGKLTPVEEPSEYLARARGLRFRRADVDALPKRKPRTSKPAPR